MQKNNYSKLAPLQARTAKSGQKVASNVFFGIASQTGFERGFEEAGTRPFFSVFYENILLLSSPSGDEPGKTVYLFSNYESVDAYL